MYARNRIFIRGATVRLICLVLTLASASIIRAAEHRNILLLVTDNQNRNDCGCYGNTQIRTPHIDRLAGEGVRFNYAFATTASCGPSRAVLYTGLLTSANGQYGHGHGVHTFRLNPKVTTVFQELHNHGYHTALLGKQHLSPESQYPLTFNEPVNGRDVMTMAALPPACRSVLDAPSPVSEAAVTVTGPRTAIAARTDAAAPVPASAFAPAPKPAEMPLPTPRPEE